MNSLAAIPKLGRDGNSGPNPGLSDSKSCVLDPQATAGCHSLRHHTGSVSSGQDVGCHSGASPRCHRGSKESGTSLDKDAWEEEVFDLGLGGK